MPVALLERYAERGIAIRKGLGLTETSPTVFLTGSEHAMSEAGSVGKPALHTEIGIVDPNGARCRSRRSRRASGTRAQCDPRVLGASRSEPGVVDRSLAAQSACGGANSAVGPHYRPPDQTIYRDETFFDELTRSLGAHGGDVAEAYVIAHEVGHHIRNQIDVMDEVREAQQAAGSQAEGNALSVQMELRADCFAGVWAHSLRDEGVFLPNGIREAIDAAAAVDDDRIQQRVQCQIGPERWTHGSSDQRVEWFTRGFETGDPSR